MTVLALSAGRAEAQEDERPPANVLVLNSGALLAGRLEIGYERAFGRRLSLTLAPSATAFDAPFVTEEGHRDVGVSLVARLFMLGHAPRGFWLAARLLVARDWLEDSSFVDGFAFAAIGELGYSWVWDWFTLQLGAGAGYTSYDVGVYVFDLSGHSWRLSFHVAMGVPFERERDEGEDEPSEPAPPRNAMTFGAGATERVLGRAAGPGALSSIHLHGFQQGSIA
jgi:hypothetical protein